MAEHSGGKIVVASAGTPVVLTGNLSALLGSASNGEGYRCQAIQVQALPGNAGLVYIGHATMVRATLVAVLTILPKPSSATTGPFPTQSWAVPGGMNTLDLNRFYLDADNNNDGVLVSFIQV